MKAVDFGEDTGSLLLSLNDAIVAGVGSRRRSPVRLPGGSMSVQCIITRATRLTSLVRRRTKRTPACS